MKAKLTLFLAGIFLAGALVGYAFAFVAPPRLLLFRTFYSAEPQATAHRLKRALDLTPDQVREIEPELIALKTALRGIRKQSRDESEAAFHRSRERIAAKLNDEQRKRFEKMAQRALERRERRFSRFRERAEQSSPGGED